MKRRLRPCVTMLCCLTGCIGEDYVAWPEQMSQPNAIIDGDEIGVDTFPAAGVLVAREVSRQGRGTFEMHVCSGVLIAKDVVLTAGHCVQMTTRAAGPHGTVYFSLAASHEAHQDAPPTADLVRVTDMVAHPDFDYDGARPGLGQLNDLALMVLEHAITDVEPAALLDDEAALGVGTRLALVGYGHVRTHGLDWGSGQKRLGYNVVHETNSHEMWIAPPGPVKCKGDSGGPSFVQIAATGGWAVAGIASHLHHTTPAPHTCAAGVVETRVDVYRPWVQSALDAACEAGRRPSCRAVARDDGPRD